MTDKEQIMIDGCNVLKCRYYQYKTLKDCEMRYPESGDCEIGLINYLFNGNLDMEKLCVDNPNCYFKQLARKTQECEEMKRKLSNQEQLYQNEIEIYDKTCLQLRQENDDLYLERLALNTANSGINSLLEIKEQENDRYRKVIEEIKEYFSHTDDPHMLSVDYEITAPTIIDIINKAKGEGKCQ